MASCLVSQHGQSITGHYLYQIEIRGTFLLLNLSLISPVLTTPREPNQERRQLEIALKGYYHIDLQKRELLARILSFQCDQASSSMFIHLAAFTRECKSEKCRSCTGVCKMNTTQHSKLHPLLAQLLRHRALCAEDLGKKKQHSRIIIPPFSGRTWISCDFLGFVFEPLLCICLFVRESGKIIYL